MTVQILTGDCRELLRTLPDASVQCCVTSPPYHGLRAYGGDAGMIGLEPTIDEHIAALVEVFREVRRVLHPTGTVWLNYGDRYWTDSPVRSSSAEAFSETWDASQRASSGGLRRSAAKNGDLKNKDLIGLPWRIAFALQAEGWWLRSDIVWHKPNPMPESVTDRPTSAYEHIFLLSRAGKYYYDAAAIAEPVIRGDAGSTYTDGKTGINGNGRVSQKRRRIKVPGGWDTGSGSHGTIHRNGRTEAEYQNADVSTSRNARNVWTIPTQGFSEAHFAVFPPEIPRRCILAGSREGDTILDPFAGAGTTLLVADRLGRHGIGIEVNPDYVQMAQKRIRNDAPLFAEVETA